MFHSNAIRGWGGVWRSGGGGGQVSEKKNRVGCGIWKIGIEMGEEPAGRGGEEERRVGRWFVKEGRNQESRGGNEQNMAFVKGMVWVWLMFHSNAVGMGEGQGSVRGGGGGDCAAPRR